MPALQKMSELFQGANFWSLVLVLAVTPAICEELAFRGFILSGFRRLGHKQRAIVYSAVLFGVTHGIVQQSLIACLLGVVLAWLAVQSGSILPGIVFHAVHNTLAVANSRMTSDMLPNASVLNQLVTPAEGGGLLFQWPVVVIGLLLSALVLMWFGRLNAPKSEEEALVEAIRRGQLVMLSGEISPQRHEGTKDSAITGTC
jgi:sodium transport system permease protein